MNALMMKSAGNRVPIIRAIKEKTQELFRVLGSRCKLSTFNVQVMVIGKTLDE